MSEKLREEGEGWVYVHPDGTVDHDDEGMPFIFADGSPVVKGSPLENARPVRVRYRIEEIEEADDA